MPRIKDITEKQKLPNEIQALSFVCRCFGIGVKELNQMLETKRKFTPQSYKEFPNEFSGMMLMRAKMDEDKIGAKPLSKLTPSEKKKRQKLDAIKIIQREALYDRVRRQDGKPLWSFTGKLTDELLSSLLNLYGRLLPKLAIGSVSTQDALWLLVANVFVPTVFVKLVQEWRSGLGPEFRGEDCWYLPVKSNGKTLKPISRILEYWGRASDLTSGYKASLRFVKKDKKESNAASAKRESLKKRFEHWRSGKHPPNNLNEIHKFVNQVIEVKWLDEPDAWKARLTLAYALQKIYDAMDESFKNICEDSSLKLAEIIKRISEERIVCDDEKFLAGSHCFFAARLLQLRLQAEKKWEPSPPQGNWFLEEIMEMAIADGYVRQRKGPVGNHVMLDEYLFDIGINELNRTFEKSKKGLASDARQP